MEKLEAVFAEIERMTEKVNVDAVFGTPATVGDRVLIPVAEVAYRFGLGAGTAPQPASQPEAEDEACLAECGRSTAEGAGGGGTAKARPIAYIELDSQGVRVQPIEDEQKIALAGILLGAWVIAWAGLVLTTLFRPRR